MRKVLVVILCFILVGCSSPDANYHGESNELSYHNNYFNFSITFNDDYHWYELNEMAKVLGISALELQENDEIQDIYEFMASPDDDSPLFQFYVESYSFTAANTYDSFIREVVAQFSEQEDVSYAVGAVVDEDINGVQFKKIPLNADAGYFVLHQDLYLIRNGKYVGTLMVTYIDGDENEVEQIINTIVPLE